MLAIKGPAEVGECVVAVDDVEKGNEVFVVGLDGETVVDLEFGEIGLLFFRIHYKYSNYKSTPIFQIHFQVAPFHLLSLRLPLETRLVPGERVLHQRVQSRQTFIHARSIAFQIAIQVELLLALLLVQLNQIVQTRQATLVGQPLGRRKLQLRVRLVIELVVVKLLIEEIVFFKRLVEQTSPNHWLVALVSKLVI